MAPGREGTATAGNDHRGSIHLLTNLKDFLRTWSMLSTPLTPATYQRRNIKTPALVQERYPNAFT